MLRKSLVRQQMGWCRTLLGGRGPSSSAWPKGFSFLSQGVSMTFNMKAYSNTKVLFETSHDGIIQGVPFAGLPVLNKMCTLHQMREVSFYYEQLRPLLTGITNAETPSTSQKAADAVAEEVVELLDPLFLAMVEAVKLFGQDDGSCNPSASMTHSEWHAFFMTLAQQEILTKTTMQYFTQVGLKVDVKSSQVEITVRLSQASGNLRNLIEGNKVKGIPAPPSQEIVDELLSVDATWKTFESELEAAVHLESVSSVTMARVDLLGERILEVLGRVMHMGLAMVTNTTVPAYVIDQSFGQALLACEITQSAVLLNFDHDVTSNWDSLNASRAAYTSTMWKLLEGEPGKYHRVTDVCLVHQVKHANDLFRRFEQAALSVGHGHSVDMENLVLLSPLVLRALEESAESLSTGNSSCGNTSLLADEWIQLHQKAAAIATLSQEITAEYILVKQGESHNTQRLEVLVEDLDTSLRHIMFGSFDPPIAAPPSQEKFDHMLTHLAPEVADLKQAIFGIDVTTVLNAGDKMMLDAQTLQDQYLEGLMSADPHWPGKRVDVARRQVTLAQKIMTEAALYAYDLRSSDAELNAVVTKFEQAHLQLRDGGGGLSEIMLPERQDLLTQWEQVDSAWQQVRGYLRTDPISRLESAILQLVAELTKIIPLYAMMDVKDPDTFPWPTLVYSIIGALILSCCCVMVILPWALSRRRATKTPHNGATVRSAADEV
ncbi:unnamed protein product [Durusdinium trenchii]|uniref:NarX-like N-terminal domain-containing protein n=1 Tax=Durusdinium trenchii TaxID=1381693 RepID=A0ABP0J4N1_9DINO